MLELLVHYDFSSPNASDWLFRVQQYENNPFNNLSWTLRVSMDYDNGQVVYKVTSSVKPSRQTLFPWFQDTATDFILYPQRLLPVIRLPARMIQMDMKDATEIIVGKMRVKVTSGGMATYNLKQTVVVYYAVDHSPIHEVSELEIIPHAEAPSRCDLVAGIYKKDPDTGLSVRQEPISYPTNTNSTPCPDQNRRKRRSIHKQRWRQLVDLARRRSTTSSSVRSSEETQPLLV